MANTKVMTKPCAVCASEFSQRTRQGRPRDVCSAACAAQAKSRIMRRYRQTEKYRESVRRSAVKKREVYDPWLWENTILEWNE
jgi:hypothetical protein